MRFVLYTDNYSPHEMPMFKACAGLFDEAVYVVNNEWAHDASRPGWSPELTESQTLVLSRLLKDEQNRAMDKLLGDNTVFMYGCYNNPFNDRIRNAQGTILYASERWLKPLCIRLPFANLRINIPGIFHLASWQFIKRTIDIVKRLRKEDRFFYFPQGIYAARDMARLCGLMAGDWKCLFKAPELEFERKPGGRIWLAQRRRGAEKYCLDKMRMFCYTVAPSDALPVARAPARPDEVRVLWVGRLLDLKRVDTIVRAVSEHADLKRVDTILPKITLDIYGSGPMEAKLKAMARGYEDVIKFYPPVPIAEVRKLMREHDVYVLASNGYEGWGAVVSEALEEGIGVLCSREAGAGATMLPEENLFDCGDVETIRSKLENMPLMMSIGPWSATNTASNLKEFADGIGRD